MTVLLINPNGSERTTEAMVRAAGKVLSDVEGLTMTGMPEMITTPEALALSAERVAQVMPAPHVTGVIVAAFGDPGRAALADRLKVPVVGIGEAAAQEARALATPFAVATTTPDLGVSIDALMNTFGHGYAGSFFTEGEPTALVVDAARLDAALLDAVERAAKAGARSVIIGGGPLADAAERLRGRASVPLIHPVDAAARSMAERLETAEAEPLADGLLSSNRTGHRFEPKALAPQSHAVAYAAQRRVSKAFGTVGGYKTGRQVGLPRIIAPIRADRCFRSGAAVAVAEKLAIELEIGFCVLRPGLADAAFDEIEAFLQPVATIELVDTRLSGAISDEPLAKLADAQMNWGLVTGGSVEGWSGADFSDVRAQLTCGGETVLDGRASVPGGSALDAVREALPLVFRYYGELVPGQVLIAGSLHPMVWYPRGTEVRGEIEGIGRVAVDLV